MYKNPQEDAIMRTRTTDYYFTKPDACKEITVEYFHSWVAKMTNQQYLDVLKFPFRPGKDTRPEMRAGLMDLISYFKTIESPDKFDYTIFVILNKTTREPLAAYLVHESPLSSSQRTAITNDLGMSLREIDDNIGELRK